MHALCHLLENEDLLSHLLNGASLHVLPKERRSLATQQANSTIHTPSQGRSGLCVNDKNMQTKGQIHVFMWYNVVTVSIESE